MSNEIMTEEFTEQQLNYVYENRRYVRRKEVVGYVLWDMAQSFNINSYSQRFVNTILQISFRYQQIISFVNGIWDIINDIFTAAIVDKTRTRWGKFKPYLVLLAIPGTAGACLYWMLPLFFRGTGTEDFSKFIAYFILAIVREGIGTFVSIAQGGIISTITPHPVERTRILTLANYFSGMFGEKLPEQIMTILLDLISNNVIKPKKLTISELLLRLFVGMGVFTSIVSGMTSLWFNTIVRERVAQSVKTPSIVQGIKSIINNKPVLLLTLSQILSSFSIGGSRSDYYIDVLNFASMGYVTGFPGALLGPVPFLIVPWFRRKFSSRTLYLLSNYGGSVLMVPIFIIGSIGGKKNGLYKNRIAMMIMMTIHETIIAVFYGLRSVIPTELYNEAMDYCEWKNGYRTEAMTSVARGLASKLAGIFTNLITLQIKRWIKYDQTAYIRGAAQSDSTKYWLFASYAILPLLTGGFGMIPIFFYDLSGHKREKMYAELLERREKISKTASQADKETMEKIAQEQFKVAEINKNKKL